MNATDYLEKHLKKVSKDRLMEENKTIFESKEFQFLLFKDHVENLLFCIENYRNKSIFRRVDLELLGILEDYKKNYNIQFVQGDWTDDRLTLKERATLFLEFLKEEENKMQL